MISVSVHADSCRTTLLDTSKTTWSDDEILQATNEAVAMACSLVPDLYVVTDEQHPLAIGVRQSLPDGGLVLIDAPYNGEGGAVTIEAQTEIARVHPTWAAAPSSSAVRFVMYDPRSPLTFMVYPPAQSGATLAIVYGAQPEDAAYLSATIPLPGWTRRALWALTLAKLYGKNTQRQDLGKAKDYLAMGTGILQAWSEAKAKRAAPVDLQGVH